MLIQPEATQVNQNTVTWWEILRSAFFWVMVLGAIFYVIRSYLRDRPELWASMQRFRPLAIVVEWLRRLGLWLRGLGRNVGTQVKKFTERLQTFRRGKGGTNAARRRGQSMRQRVFYHYLNTLDQAREAGIPRRITDTPYEYNQTLGHQITEAEQDITHLTETFVEARYSQHPITEQTVEQVQASAEHINATLQEVKQSREIENDSQ
jgi:hypothetical protein